MARRPIYRVQFQRHAEHELSVLPVRMRVRIATRINALAVEPRPPGSKKLTGVEDLCRIRIGEYRVVYKIRSHDLVILVVRVAHRREVYRQ